MTYKYDIFISYNRGFIDDWLIDNFLPFFKWHLESALGRPPTIFIDREGIFTGDCWPLRLKEALSHSRCLIAFWSPSYFRSEWCIRECSVMYDREKKEGFRTIRNPSGLIIPVNVSDGDFFPEFAKNTEWFDCRDFILKGQGFQKTEQYVEFQTKIKEWAMKVANSINNAPRWNQEWINDQNITIQEVLPPKLKPPFMG